MTSQRAGQSQRRGELLSDQTGQVHIEYLLVVVAVGIPMLLIFAGLMRILTDFYREMTFWNAMPFP